MNRLISRTCTEGGAKSGKNRLKARRACIFRFPGQWEVLGSVPAGLRFPADEELITAVQEVGVRYYNTALLIF